MRVVPEEVYTVREVAAMTGYSRQTVTRLFQNERGVLVIERAEQMNKRRYRSIRISRVVYERVLEKLAVK
jgi:AcrR family transcriptional regulator